MNSYYQVVEPLQNEIVIKRSRFITTVMPIISSDDADNFIKLINKKYSDATHNCYCYISNTIATMQRFSDDGEPQGTAGLPMLEVIKKRSIYMTLVVVTRYFGGVKLGASGLVGAYTDSVVQALDKASVKKLVYSNIANFETSYNLITRAIEIITEYNGKVININYDEKITVQFAIAEETYEQLSAKLIDYSLGRIVIQIINKDYIDYEI